MRRSAKTLGVGAIASVALLLSTLTAFAEDPVSEPDSPPEDAVSSEIDSEVPEEDLVTLDLYNMTDIHGHIEASEDGKEAGLASTACYVKKAKTENENSVFTLLGDNIGASPFTSGSQDDNPTIAALNKSDVFASAIGNHEFDMGMDVLNQRFAGEGGFTQIEFDYLASNIVMNDTGNLMLEPFKIWESPSGITVGYVGAIEEDAPTKVAPGTFDAVTFLSAADQINKYAADLKDGDDSNGEADIVVALYDNDILLSAPRLSNDVDVLMGGDTHKPYYFDALENRDGNMIPATASGNFTDNLANVQLKVDKTTKEVVEAKAIQIPASDLIACGEDAEVKAIVDQAVANAKDAMNQVVIETDSAFYRGKQASGENRGVESTLGGLVADAMKGSFTTLEGDPIDIGIINAGGLRADLVPTDGEITVGDVFAVAPFSNEVGYVEMTGAQFKTLLEQQWKVLGENSTRPMLKLGLSENVKYTYNQFEPMGNRISSILIDGEPIDPEATYTVGSVTFLLAGGDSFDVLKEESIASTLTTIPDGLDRQWIQKYLEANPNVAPREAVSSVGITYDGAAAESVNGIVKGHTLVWLRGLSFSGPGEAMPETVTVSFAGQSVTAEVNNTLEDPNAGNEKAIVTTDGVGYLNEPVKFNFEYLCQEIGLNKLPITVTTDDGIELVSEAHGQYAAVACDELPDPDDGTTDPTEPGTPTEPGDGSTDPVTPTNPDVDTTKPGTDSPDNLAKTGVSVLGTAAGALALLLAGVAMAVVRRRQA